MAMRTAGARRALAGGLLVLVLVVTGAMPVAAGGSGPGASGPNGKPAGVHSGGGHKGNAGPQQVRSGSAPSARKSQGSSPRPARHRAGAPRTNKAITAAPAKPSAPKTPAPAERKPEHEGDGREPDRAVDDGQERRRPSSSLDTAPRTEIRPATAAAARQAVSRVDGPRAPGVIDRPVAAAAASAADPSAALLTPPPVVEIQTAAAAELEPRRFWPTLPGAAGHPAFPGLLAAVLLGFVALGFRGDRRDPKLAAAAIDGRDDRAAFR